MQPLLGWLKAKGEKVDCLNFSLNAIPQEESDREAYLTSERLRNVLQHVSSHTDRLLLISKTFPKSFEIEALSAYADCLFYGISDEQMSDLDALPENTLFFIQDSRTAPLLLHRLQPRLEQLMKRWTNSSFSALKSAWERFPLKKI